MIGFHTAFANDDDPEYRLCPTSFGIRKNQVTFSLELVHQGIPGTLFMQ